MEAIDFDTKFREKLDASISNLKLEAQKIFNDLMKNCSKKQQKEISSDLDDYIVDLKSDEFEITDVLLRDFITQKEKS